MENWNEFGKKQCIKCWSLAKDLAILVKEKPSRIFQNDEMLTQNYSKIVVSILTLSIALTESNGYFQ